MASGADIVVHVCLLGLSVMLDSRVEADLGEIKERKGEAGRRILIFNIPLYLYISKTIGP